MVRASVFIRLVFDCEDCKRIYIYDKWLNNRTMILSYLKGNQQQRVFIHKYLRRKSIIRISTCLYIIRIHLDMQKKSTRMHFTFPLFIFPIASPLGHTNCAYKNVWACKQLELLSLSQFHWHTLGDFCVIGFVSPSSFEKEGNKSKRRGKCEEKLVKVRKKVVTSLKVLETIYW